MAQRLFIGNLPHASSEDDLRDFVSNAGFQVDSVAVIRDKMTGRSRGFGFVELAEGEDMKRAIEGLNGQELEGRRLTVNEARPARSDFSSRPPRGGGGGGGRGGGGGSRGGGGGSSGSRWN